jgi:hypothetical protein
MGVTNSKKVKLKENVYKTIRNDIPLRHKIASALGVEVSSIYGYAGRKSPSLSKPFVLDIISEHMGESAADLLDHNQK